jgi:hypothetical protein
MGHATSAVKSPGLCRESPRRAFQTLVPTRMHTPGVQVLCMDTPYTYSEILKVSNRISWRLEDVLGEGETLDFSSPFLPDSLAATAELRTLGAPERLLLNQIRGHSYLSLFGLVEEFILPFLLDHARGQVYGDDAEIRALLQFAGEEAKHIELFKRFAALFRKGFDSPCEVIGPSRDIADAVLEHSQLGVALVVLHIEWMTQRHYVESIKTETALDPLFKRLLHHHWLEESQHAKLDTLIAHQIAGRLGSTEIRQGITDYERILSLFEGALARQAELDLEALERVTGGAIRTGTRQQILAEQRRSYRSVFIESGAQHPNLRRTLSALAA